MPHEQAFEIAFQLDVGNAEEVEQVRILAGLLREFGFLGR